MSLGFDSARVYREAELSGNEITPNAFCPERKKVKESEVAQSPPTFCDPMDCGPLGPSIHGIFQARILEWVAISFSK